MPGPGVKGTIILSALGETAFATGVGTGCAAADSVQAKLDAQTAKRQKVVASGFFRQGRKYDIFISV